MASRFGQSSQEKDGGSCHRGADPLSFVCLKHSFYNPGALVLALKRGAGRPPASPSQLAELGLNPGALSLGQVSTAGQCSSGISEFPAFLGDAAQPTCPAQPALPTGLDVPPAAAQPAGCTPVCALLAPPRPAGAAGTVPGRPPRTSQEPAQVSSDSVRLCAASTLLSPPSLTHHGHDQILELESLRAESDPGGRASSMCVH